MIYWNQSPPWTDASLLCKVVPHAVEAQFHLRLGRERRGNLLWPGALNLASHPPSLIARRGSEPTKVAGFGSRR